MNPTDISLLVAHLAGLAVGVLIGMVLGRLNSGGDEAGPSDPDQPVWVQEYLSESDRLVSYAVLTESANGMDADFTEGIKAAALVIAANEHGCNAPDTAEA